MQMDLRTVSIKPQRQTFDHIARRLGSDKSASRYQEGTLDIQATHNFHYRPTWNPQHELYDPTKTRIVMVDWYAFKDPRQFYYATYTSARARQQEVVEGNFEFFESRNLGGVLPDEVRRLALDTLVPLRHAAYGANLNNTEICAEGYGTAITQPCMYHAADHLGIAQYITRAALVLSDLDVLQEAKAAWLAEPRWQGLRRYVENTLVLKDWFELFVAQNFVLDGLLYPLVYETFIDRHLTARGGAPLAMLTAFMPTWFSETSKWVDATIKTAAAESAENKAILTTWSQNWHDRAVEALRPVAAQAFGAEAESVMTTVIQSFTSRAGKIGLSL